jgi:hypothetical protein
MDITVKGVEGLGIRIIQDGRIFFVPSDEVQELVQHILQIHLQVKGLAAEEVDHKMV